MAKKLHSSGNRAFLNRKGHHTDASVSFSVEVNTNSSGDSVWCDGQMHIRDCNDRVELCLDFRNKEELRNTIFKLRTLQSMCGEAIEACIDAHASFKENKDT